MKILIVAHEYYPRGSGIANLVYEIKKSFEKKGNTVKICSPIGPDFKSGSQKIIKKSGAFGLLLFWRKAANLINSLKEDFDVIWLHNPLLTKKIKKKNVVVTTHTTYTGAYTSYISKTNDFIRKTYYKIIMPIEKYSYKKINKNLKKTVTSKATILELKNLGVKDKDIKIIPNGVNFSEKKKKRKKDAKTKILYVGRFDYQKNLLSLLSVFKELEKLNEEIILDMIGDGDQMGNVKAFIKKNRISNVKLMGKIQFRKVIANYETHDYLILSSLYEGFPMTLVEAMSKGCIPILSNIQIFKDVVHKIGIGININFNKKDAAEKINEYIKRSDKKLRSLQEDIMKKTKNAYDWDKISSDYLNIFEKIIKV